MIPVRLILITLGMVVVFAAAAWLRHDATERERGRQAEATVNTLTRAEEARRAADADALRAADPADELRQHWRRPE